MKIVAAFLLLALLGCASQTVEDDGPATGGGPDAEGHEADYVTEAGGEARTPTVDYDIPPIEGAE